MCNTTLCKSVLEKIAEFEIINKNNNDAGDATWILTSAFIIFTMQSGFGLLEVGSVSVKNECNIMVKNAVDVIFGGLAYWLFGFSLSFGKDKVYSNGFSGFGNFLVMEQDDKELGKLYAKYFFQLSFATTATTIVSGAMAERTNLKAYILFSFLNVLSYVFPAHWVWADDGWLRQLGVVDVAGCGPVHIVGGAASLVATIMLKPRKGIFDQNHPTAMACPTNVLLGTFMLWWGWLGFNCGSTFGISGVKWKLASRAAITTVNASIGGGIWSVFYCYVIAKRFNGKLDIGIFTGSILGGLVSITGVCALCEPWEALIIGIIGGAIVCYGKILVEFLKVDDPVSCVPIHLICGIWGMLCVGLFSNSHDGIKIIGVFKGGSNRVLGYQVLAVVCILSWVLVTSAIELFICDLIFGLRISARGEHLGADAFEHGISYERGPSNSKSKEGSSTRSSSIFGRNRNNSKQSHTSSSFTTQNIPSYLETYFETTDKKGKKRQYQNSKSRNESINLSYNTSNKQTIFEKNADLHISFVKETGTENYGYVYESNTALSNIDHHHTVKNNDNNNEIKNRQKSTVKKSTATTDKRSSKVTKVIVDVSKKSNIIRKLQIENKPVVKNNSFGVDHRKTIPSPKNINKPNIESKLRCRSNSWN